MPPKKYCNAVFMLDKQTHAENRDFTRRMREYGGNLAFDMKTKTLCRGDIDHGKYNGIQMSRGVVDWHSHPARCLNNDTCAIGLPSPADLKNIMVGALFGTSAHLVYAKEGTYLVQVRASTLRKLQHDDREHTLLQRELHAIEKTFDALHDKFVNSNMKYPQYIVLWMKAARKHHFNARLFKGDTLPRVHVYYDCHFVPKNKTHFVPRVTVPHFLDDKDV